MIRLSNLYQSMKDLTTNTLSNTGSIEYPIPNILKYTEQEQQVISSVPDEIWKLVLTYLDPYSLSTKTCLINHSFKHWSEQDILWKIHCAYRWQGKKHNWRLFMTNNTTMMDTENDSIHNTAMMTQPHYQAIMSEFTNNLRTTESSSSSSSTTTTAWKRKYEDAEHDAKRQQITNEEIISHSWQLIYNGSPSRLGLRQFGKDGTYHSPYAGDCEWALQHNFFCIMGMSLVVERCSDWGWIIGRGTRTVYLSSDDHRCGDKSNTVESRK